MKQFLLATLIIATLFTTSCSKEDLTTKDCSCGEVIVLDSFAIGIDTYYTVSLENYCSGNTRVIFVEYEEYKDFTLGDSFCFTNTADAW